MNSESHSGGITGVAVQTRAPHVAVPTVTRSDNECTSSLYRNSSPLGTGRLDSAHGAFSTQGCIEHTSDFDDDIDVTLNLAPAAAIKAPPMNPATTEIVPPVLAAPALPEIKTSAAPQAVFEPTAAAEGVLLRDRYLLGRVVGTGGNGVVYQARDLRREKSGSNSHDVAIKVLRDEFDADRHALARLKREFAHAQELSHPNIVRVYDIDCQNDFWFITMELLDGRTLADVLRDPALSQDRHIVTASIAACATAMQYAHSRGILHCDFKPSNIFLTRDGEVKLLDFGAACEYGPQAAQVRATRSATLAYASPQVLRCERPDPRDDIFSLACVSYEWLTGQHPFERRSSAHAMASGMQLRKLPGLTQRQYAALKQALSWEREERPETVADFCRALGVDETEREPGRLRFPEWLNSVDRGATARIAATAALLAITLLTVLALPNRHPGADKELIHATAASTPLPHRVGAAVIASAPAGRADIEAKVRVANLRSTLLPVLPQHDLGDSLRRVSTRMFGANGEPSVLQPVAWHAATATYSGEGATALPANADTSTTKSAEKPTRRVPSQIVALQDASITVSSRASMAVVPLVRRNGESGLLRVKWRTLPGSAKPDVDYRTVTAGAVNFLDSQANQVLYVPLVNADRRGNRSFSVELQGVAGGARLDNTMTAHITIRDDG